MARVRVFRKELWLQSANAQKERGTLLQREINDALEIWVNAIDGKTAEEIEQSGGGAVREDWFEEIEI